MTPEYPDACERLVGALADPDIPLRYTPWFREYGIVIQDGGTSMLVIDHCPFCGTRLPRSVRAEWFDRLDALGLEPEDNRVPPEMRSDRWWRLRDP